MSTSMYMCVGASSMLAVVIAVYLLVKFGKRVHQSFVAWGIKRDMAYKAVLDAKYGTTQVIERQPSVLDIPLIVKLAVCATDIKQGEDTNGQPTLMFKYDGNQLCVTKRRDLYIWIHEDWRLIGDRSATSKLVLNMQSRKALPEGKKQQSNKAKAIKHQNNDDDDDRPVLKLKLAQQWCNEERRWTNRPDNRLPDGYKWRQFKGGAYGIEEVEVDE